MLCVYPSTFQNFGTRFSWPEKAKKKKQTSQNKLQLSDFYLQASTVFVYVAKKIENY